MDNEQQVESPKGDQIKDLAERFGRLESGFQAQGQMSQLMADPDVRALLAAKQAGKQVKIVDAQLVESPKNPFEGDDKDFEKMSTKELASMMTDQAVIKASKIAKDANSVELEGVKRELALLKQAHVQGAETNIKAQVDKVKSNNIDFETHRQSMVDINRQNPGLTVDELLVMARLRAGKAPTAPKPTGLASERPTHGLGKVRKAGEELKGGQKEFDDMLSKSLSSNPQLEKLLAGLEEEYN